MKMSKSSQTESTNFELTEQEKFRAKESECEYWKTRYELLKKYGKMEML